jgi:hypothetical protein
VTLRVSGRSIIALGKYIKKSRESRVILVILR